MISADWNALRKQARILENDIDVKLVAFNKVGAGHGSGTGHGQTADTAPLLGDSVFESLSLEIAQMLDKLVAINEKMAEQSTTSTAMVHTLQRHIDILNGYKQEFHKIEENHTTRIEREELLRGSSVSSNAGLSRRDMYLKESTHLHSSSGLVNDQINIAIETKEHLLSQRHQFKRLQTRFNDLSNRFPLISSLLQRINIKKRRDSMILGGVIAFCTILLILYALH